MLFAVPSKGRAGITTTQNILTNCVFYVPEYEAETYRKCLQKAKVVGVPNNVKGITATRNYILQSTTDKRVVMIDDDLKVQGWTKLGEYRAKQLRMSGKNWEDISARLFDVTEDMQWKIWGVATQAALRSIYPYKPILSRSYVTASFMGIVNDGTYMFDEKYKVKEDYEICLRHIKQYGGIVAARFCYWENKHWTDDGGCKDYRTGQIELEAIEMLKTQYPGMIRKITRGNSDYSIELEF